MPCRPRAASRCLRKPGRTNVVKQLAQRWGADNIRDSDGTELSETLLAMGLDVFSTVCLVRAEQTWPKLHPEHLPRKFLCSDPVTARGSTVEIIPMSGFLRPASTRSTRMNDPKRWWDVHDRTTGKIVPPANWEFDATAGKVTIRKAKAYHLYTVNFLVMQTGTRPRCTTT